MIRISALNIIIITTNFSSTAGAEVIFYRRSTTAWAARTDAGIILYVYEWPLVVYDAKSRLAYVGILLLFFIICVVFRNEYPVGN